MLRILRAIPILLPFFIELLPRIPGGAVLALLINESQPINDAEALRDLNRAQTWRARRKPGYNDSSHVVKVSDVIDCIEGEVNNRAHWLAVAKEVARSLVGTPRNSMSALGDDFIKCVREKTLRQDTPRLHGHRPALGHGRGRIQVG